MYTATYKLLIIENIPQQCAPAFVYVALYKIHLHIFSLNLTRGQSTSMMPHVSLTLPHTHTTTHTLQQRTQKNISDRLTSGFLRLE